MKRTLKTLMVLAAFAGFASAANAVSVVLSANQGTYNPGETITLTVKATTSDSPGTTDINLLGRILHTSAAVTPLANAAQFALTGPGGSFGLGGLAACSTTDCEVFDQVAFPAAINPLATNFTLATNGYTAGATNISGWRVVSFSWKTVNPGKFDFFGLTNAPGTTITIVPEPTTAAMLGLGLLGLALAGRRRA